MAGALLRGGAQHVLPPNPGPEPPPSRFSAASWSRRGAVYRDRRFIATLASLCVVRAAEKSFPGIVGSTRALDRATNPPRLGAPRRSRERVSREAPNDTLKASRREEHV